MAIIDVLTYRGEKDILVWKWFPIPSEKKRGFFEKILEKPTTHREDQLRLGTQLVVGPTQVAVFVKEGQIADIFGPGTFTLSTKNLPLLDKLVGLPFGKESPFKAEVYYVNKSVVMDISFDIPQFNMLEQNFRVPIPVKCYGSFAVKAGEARQFLTRLLGSIDKLSAASLKDYFCGLITEQVKSTVIRFAREQHLGPLELEGLVSEVSSAIKPIVQDTFNNFGIKLELFNMKGISIVDNDPRVKKVIEEYQRLMSQDIEERMRLRRRAENLDVYRVERSFDTTEKAAESLGTMGGGGDSGGIMGTIVGMGMAQPLANQMGGLMSGILNQNMQTTTQQQSQPPNQKQESKDVFTLLKELDGLRKAGVLTEEEFAEKKSELLSKI